MKKAIRAKPWGDGNAALWGVKCEAEDKQFLTIFHDFSRLIRKSEEACERAAHDSNVDYLESVVDREGEYLEELIGASFLILQTKIRRVSVAVEKLLDHMRRDYKVPGEGLTRDSIFMLAGQYNNTPYSQVGLIWDVGNYYKHRDEWRGGVWSDCDEEKALKQSRATRKRIELVGIVRHSTGNMRTAYEFFGVTPNYSECGRLADEVQAWAEFVYEYVQEKVEEEISSSSGW